MVCREPRESPSHWRRNKADGIRSTIGIFRIGKQEGGTKTKRNKFKRKSNILIRCVGSQGRIEHRYFSHWKTRGRNENKKK